MAPHVDVRVVTAYSHGILSSARGLLYGPRVLRIKTTALLATTVCIGGCIGGCFYDSRWGEAKRTQQHNAQAMAPAEIHAEGRASGAPRQPMRTIRVRALVTQAFTAHVVDAPKFLREMIDEANRITQPALSVRLELDGVHPWERNVDESVEDALAALHATESGHENEVVVGFLGALPRATASFHELGYADVVGRHMVMRAPGSAQQHDAVDRNFDELSEEERRGMIKSLVHHRSVAVFLHELGHTLGSVHETRRESLMFPEYSRRMASYGDDALRVMRLGLEKRAEGKDDRAVAEALVADYRAHATENAFVTDPASLARLERFARGAVAAKESPPSPSAPREPVVPETPGLSEVDRKVFVAAHAMSEKAEMVNAWNTAKPLFTTYKDSLEVQDFRCRIATASMPFQMARKECARLMELATGKGGR